MAAFVNSFRRLYLDNWRLLAGLVLWATAVYAATRFGLRTRSTATNTESRVFRVPTRQEPVSPREVLRLGHMRWQVALDSLGFESIPIQMIAKDESLLLVDGTGDVLALNTSTAKRRWRHKAEHFGLRGYQLVPLDHRTALLFGADSNEVVVFDWRSGALLGKWSRRLSRIRGSCAARDGVLLSGPEGASSLQLIDLKAILRRKYELPWPEYGGAHFLQKQTLLSRDESAGICVAALSVGDGLAAFSAGGPVWIRHYVERFRTPDVFVRSSLRPDGVIVREASLSNHSLSARDLATWRGLIFVAFGGATDMAARFIDMYSTADARYLGTFTYPAAVRRIAAGDGMLFIGSYQEGRPVIEAFSLDSTTGRHLR